MNMDICAISDHRLSTHVMPIKGDGMEPTLKANRDYVVCIPVKAFLCEGIYLIDDEFFRCERSVFGGEIRVWQDNPRYNTEYTVTNEVFEASVRAIVVADINVRNPVLMRDMVAA